MKNIFVIFAALHAAALCAAPGCLDNSWHMAKPFDNKQYHIVSNDYGNDQECCQCPCKKVSSDRGYCIECGHYRYFQPMVIIRKNKAEQQ